jgi:hypothetical protein
MEELKPCPFCGGKPRAWSWSGGARIDCENWLKGSDPDVHYVGVGARTMDEAVKRWNRRVDNGSTELAD